MRRSLTTLSAIAITTAFLIALVAATPAFAGDRNWRLTVAGMVMDTDGGVSARAGAHVSVETRVATGAGMALSVERKASDLVGVELGLAGASPDMRFRVSASPGDVLTSADFLTVAPLTCGVNFHLTPDSPVDFHLGPLLAYVVYSDLRLRTGTDHDWGDFPFINGGASTTVEVGNDTDVTWGFNAGADLGFGTTGRWSLHAGLKYIDSEYELTRERAEGARVRMDPLMLRLGLSFRF